jgi:hypothetical protein
MIVMSALVIDTFGGERIDAGRSRNPPTIAAKGIKPHLICRDEQYISFIVSHRLHHRCPPEAGFFVCGLDPQLGLFPTSTVEHHNRRGLVNTQFRGIQHILIELT